MATRFYLPSTGAAEVSPPYSGDGGMFEWNKTSEADRLKMVRTKISSAFAIKTCSEDVATTYNVLNRQYVSAPIGAHDFTGCTFRIQVRCMEDNAKADFRLQACDLRIVSNDGQTVRHLLSSYQVTFLEFDDDVLENRMISGTVFADKSSQNGDRLVLEIGINATNTKTNLYTATMDFGDASGTDLPENKTETAQYNPWIEFSHDIPEAAGDEFVYAGDVPLTVLPSTPKGLMSMVYGGDILMATMPSYTSILDKIYAGAVPLTVLPDAPKAPLEKSYAGILGLALVPNSTYGLAVQYVYGGDLAVGILPSYASILDRVYSGDIPLIALPGYSSILDRIYSGDIALVVLPNAPVAPLSKSYGGDVGLALIPNSIYELISGAGEFIYAGDIPLMALPSHALIMDRIYQGAVGLGILPDFPKAFLEKSYFGNLPLLVLPDFPKAILEKAYEGDINFILIPNSLYSLEEISEFLYAGDIPVSLLPDYSSALEKAYSGDINIAAILASLYSGIRAAPEFYPPGIPVKKEPKMILIGDKKELILIGKKKPDFIDRKKPILISKEKE